MYFSSYGVGLCLVGGCQFVAALWNKMQWKPRWNTAHYEEYYRAMLLHPTLPHITLHCITVLLASPTPRPGAALVGASSLGQVAALDSLVHWNFCNSRGSTLHLVARHCTTGAVSLLHCIVLSIGLWQRDGGLVANIGRLAAPTHGQDALLDRCKPLLDEKCFSGIVSGVKASFNGLSEVNHDLQ